MSETICESLPPSCTHSNTQSLHKHTWYTDSLSLSLIHAHIHNPFIPNRLQAPIGSDRLHYEFERESYGTENLTLQGKLWTNCNMSQNRLGWLNCFKSWLQKENVMFHMNELTTANSTHSQTKNSCLHATERLDFTLFKHPLNTKWFYCN